MKPNQTPQPFLSHSSPFDLSSVSNESQNFANIIEPHCPWHNMYEKFGPANVKWCEERLCTWINEPLNAWSNLAYFLIALYLLYIALKKKNSFDFVFGITLFFVGLTSFIFHATNNYLTQIFDFLGMYMFIYLLFVMGLLKLKWVSSTRAILIYFSLISISVAMIPVFKKYSLPYQSIVLLIILGVIFTQFRIYFKRPEKYPLAYLIFAVGTFVIAAAFSALDASRIWCTPENHFIQGHALWHLLGAVGCWFMYKVFKLQNAEMDY